MSNTVVFEENYRPISGETLNSFSPSVLKMVPSVLSVLSVFRRYLSHLTCGIVIFCCIEIKINIRSIWSTNYFAPPTDSNSPYAILVVVVVVVVYLTTNQRHMGYLSSGNGHLAGRYSTP